MGKSIIGLILWGLVSAPAPGFAASAWTYQVEGVGAIVSDDQAGARQQAIRAALSEALEEAVLNVLDADAVVANIQQLNQRLYTQPWSYVSSYRVLWEYPDAPGKVYRVGVVVEIALPRVQQALAALGGPVATAGGMQEAQADDAARLAILVTERHLGQATSTWWAERGVVTRALRSQLAERGVRIGELEPGLQWDGSEGGALKAAREAEIATLLVGHAGVQQIYNAVSGSAVHAILQLRVLDAPTGGVLAQERGEANVEDTQTGQASALALERAVLTVVPRLMPFLSAALEAREPDPVTTP
ncbi:MAG: hypothetical protein OXC69_05405 [Candidatus Tectomicrobia bacterium]|nr:hypothetical protein [Candidatus Tectomicrobia bacterium]